jgi:hypothetical protein
MAKAKTKPKSPFEGLWHIVSMSGWDEDYFNEEVQAFIEFEANGTGHFQFGYLQGYMDWRPGPPPASPSAPDDGPSRSARRRGMDARRCVPATRTALEWCRRSACSWKRTRRLATASFKMFRSAGSRSGPTTTGTERNSARREGCTRVSGAARSIGSKAARYL